MKKSTKYLLILFIFLGIYQPIFSQETIVLTLDESIRLALAQNPFHLAIKEKLTGASHVVREAASRFFPSANAQGLHTLDEKLFVLEFPSFIPGQPSQKISIDFTRDFQFALSVSMPLFTGGRLHSGFKQARYSFMSTKESIKQSKQEVIFNVKKAFYGYLVAKKFVGVAEEAVELAEKHRVNVNNLYKAGLASRFDLLRTEVQVANLKPQLIRAKNSVSTAELSLKILLGLKLTQPVEISGELSFKPFEVDISEHVSKAIINRPEINQLKYQRLMAVERMKIARASKLPTLSLVGAYNWWADRFNFKQNTWQNYYSINLIMTVPIFNGFATSARVGQSRALIKEMDFNIKGLLEIVNFEVRQAGLKLNQAKESLLSQEKNLKQAQESVRIAEINYSEGMATSLDVSSVQMALTQAKTNYAQALFDYVISIAQLEKARGSQIQMPNE